MAKNLIIGSHNTFTYLPPKKWWMKLFSGIGKCQEKDYKEQYKLRARVFDVRVRFDKHGNIIVAHNLREVKMSEKELYDFFKFLNRKKNCSCRVMLELRKKTNDEALQIEHFRYFCESLAQQFEHIVFFGGRVLYSWDEVYNFGTDVPLVEMHASVCAPKLIDDWYPKHYAKKNNHKNIEALKDEQICLLIDFVNIQ